MHARSSARGSEQRKVLEEKNRKRAIEQVTKGSTEIPPDYPDLRSTLIKVMGEEMKSA